MKKLCKMKVKMFQAIIMAIKVTSLDFKVNQEKNGIHMTDMMEQEEEEEDLKRKALEKEIGVQKS